jgi:hypothetical protein
MKYILPLLILLCISCKQEPKIEIYLLKERVEFYEGVPILEAEKFKDRREYILADGLQDSRWDTIENRFVFAGEFNVAPNQLEDKPFISDEEIRRFYKRDNAIVFDSILNQKIKNLKPHMRTGVQFALTVDQKVVLTGYWWSTFSSYWCDTYHIYTSPNSSFPESPDVPKEDEEVLYFIDYGSFAPEHKKKERPPYPPQLIEAFRSSGRLFE